jgi:hypothetical protein
MEVNRIRRALAACQAQWAKSKASLQKDNSFLSNWLRLLVTLEQYIPYKPDTARKNMLTNLITRNA